MEVDIVNQEVIELFTTGYCKKYSVSKEEAKMMVRKIYQLQAMTLENVSSGMLDINSHEEGFIIPFSLPYYLYFTIEKNVKEQSELAIKDILTF